MSLLGNERGRVTPVHGPIGPRSNRGEDVVKEDQLVVELSLTNEGSTLVLVTCTDVVVCVLADQPVRSGDLHLQDMDEGLLSLKGCDELVRRDYKEPCFWEIRTDREGHCLNIAWRWGVSGGEEELRRELPRRIDRNLYLIAMRAVPYFKVTGLSYRVLVEGAGLKSGISPKLPLAREEWELLRVFESFSAFRNGPIWPRVFHTALRKNQNNSMARSSGFRGEHVPIRH
jgi:hypothetical protein